MAIIQVDLRANLHLQLTGGFCLCKVLLPSVHSDWREMLEFSSVVLSTLSPYHALQLCEKCVRVI